MYFYIFYILTDVSTLEETGTDASSASLLSLDKNLFILSNDSEGLEKQTFQSDGEGTTWKHKFRVFNLTRTGRRS